MKALGYFKKNELKDFAIQEIEVPTPELRPHDVLVRVHAISTNPVETKVRRRLDGKDGRPVILGWDAAGVIEQIGTQVTAFAPGDEVFYAGDLTRDGSYAERQAIDSRLIARKPRSLSFAASAALPLTSLTAWEALLARYIEYTKDTRVLVIGGAGGVGSIATQLLKAKTPATVITTASRPETVEWAKTHGADIVLDHRKDLRQELEKHGINEVDVVFITTRTEQYLPQMPAIVRPFGHVALIDDDAGVIDVGALKPKSISVHWEMMFTKAKFGYQPQSQGDILAEVAALADAKRITSTANTVLSGFSVENIRRAHQLQESGTSIGKIVIDFSAR